MSAATRGLSKYLVELCARRPQVALVFLPLAGLIAYNGLSDANFAEATRGKPSTTMQVERVYNEVNRPIFPKYRAAGRTNDGPVVVGLSKNEFRKLKAGDSLEIIETGSADKPFVTHRYSNTQLGWVRFSLGGIPFNDAAIFGCVGGLIAIAWAFFGRQFADRSSQSRATDPEDSASTQDTELDEA